MIQKLRRTPSLSQSQSSSLTKSQIPSSKGGNEADLIEVSSNKTSKLREERKGLSPTSSNPLKRKIDVVIDLSSDDGDENRFEEKDKGMESELEVIEVTPVKKRRRVEKEVTKAKGDEKKGSGGDESLWINKYEPMSEVLPFPQWVAPITHFNSPLVLPQTQSPFSSIYVHDMKSFGE